MRFTMISSVAALALATPALAQAGDKGAEAEAGAFDVHALKAAHVPLVALPLDTGQRSANLWVKGERPKDNVLARVRLAPVRAVVVEEDLGQGAGKPLVLGLALSGAAGGLVTIADLAKRADERLYCADGVGPRFAGKLLCLQDGDGDGRFERSLPGTAESGVDYAQLALLGKPETLDRPIAYRAARAEEVPVVDTVYSNCGKDHDRPRYALSVDRKEAALDLRALLEMGPITPEALAGMNPAQLARIAAMLEGRSGGGACLAGEKMTAGDPLYPAGPASGAIAARLGELVIAVGPKDEGAPVRLVGLSEPERLYRLDGGAVLPLADAVTTKQNALAVSQKFDKPVLMTAGDAAVFEGERGIGDTVLETGFSHGYMGVLTQDTKIRTLLSSRSLPQGTVLYGVPMSSQLVTTINGIPQGGGFRMREPSADEVRLVWCVPVEDEGKWSATCLPNEADRRYTLLKGQRPAFEVTGLRYDAGTSTNDGKVPVVEQAGTLGKPLRYRFAIKAISDAEIMLVQETLFGDAVVHSRDHAVPRMKGMASGLSLGGGMIRFAAADGADGKIMVTEAKPFRAGSDARVTLGIVRAPTDEAAPTAAADVAQAGPDGGE